MKLWGVVQASQPAEGAVTAGTIASTASFFAATLAYIVTAATITAGAALNAPTVLAEQNVTGNTIASSATVNEPTVVPDQPIAAGTIASGSVTYAATVIGSKLPTWRLVEASVPLKPKPRPQAKSWGPAQIVDDSQDVESGTIANTPTLSAPTVSAPYSEAAHFAASAQLFAPTAAYGLTAGTVASGLALNGPSTTYNATTGTIGSTASLNAPAVASAAEVTGGTIGSTASLTAPEVTPDRFIGRVSSAAANKKPSHRHSKLAWGPANLDRYFGIGLPFIASGQQLFAPTADLGAITTGHIGPTVQFFSPTVTAPTVRNANFGFRYVKAAPVARNRFAYGETTSWSAEFDLVGEGEQAVGAGTVGSGSTLYAPTVTPQAVTVGGATYTNAPSLNAPAAAYGVNAATIGSGAVLFAPELLRVELPVIESGSQVFAPSVAVGAVEVVGSVIGSGSVLYPPVLGAGAVTILGSHIASSEALHSGVVAVQPVTIIGALIPSTAQVYEPWVTTGSFVDGSTIESGVVLYSGELSTSVITAFLASGAVVYIPQVSYTQEIIIGVTIISDGWMVGPRIGDGIGGMLLLGVG